MEKQTKRLLLLFSLILVVIPMVIFPERLGMPLISGSAVYMLFEFVYYGVVLYFVRRQASLKTILIGSAMTLVYRMGLGAVFGLSVIIMHAMDSTVAFSLGMAKYLPAVLLHVIAAPFVMRMVYVGLADNLAPISAPQRQFNKPVEPTIINNQETTAPYTTSTEEKPISSSIGVTRMESVTPTPAPTDHENQFERAVAYIGESASVKMALLVDEEGLTLAGFSRCDEDFELWAPLSIILENNNRRVLQHYNRGGDPDKIDIGTRNARIILRRIEHVTLMILAEQNIDETILIRIAQAADMVRKYMSERYSPALFARVEERYVSNS
jgi:predicted regulator of Ras-like GTPase activity (Roadblock/LC7/MglB family)